MSYISQSNAPRRVGNSYFTVDGARLTIHVTDSTESLVPEQKVEMEDKTKGTVRWYNLEERTSRISKHWRDTLANELCHKFLLLDYGGFHNVQFTLTDFPTGYHLYTDNVGTGAAFDDVRRDAYLCTERLKFRSPQEALCHFAWLMCGKPPNRCRCIYDDGTWKRKQGALNRAMEAEWHTLRDDRAKKRFGALQRGEQYEPAPLPGTGFNEASFLRTTG